MSVQVVILAAGQGKRMFSALPKVLHPLAGQPLLAHVIRTALSLSAVPSPIIVYGHQGHLLQHTFSEYPLQWLEQAKQLGTGHALLQALPLIADEDQVLVLYGDVPLISKQTLQHLIENTPAKAIGLITALLPNPFGYGRIKRDVDGKVKHIVEEKDATEAERAIQEVNSGIYLVPALYLKKWLPHLKNTNAQNEYYLTDIIAEAVQANIPIHTVHPNAIQEIVGVNDRVQLAQLERFYQTQLAEKLMRQGVTIADPARLDIRGDVTIGQDVMLDVNVILEGQVVIGVGSVVGPNSILRNTVVGERVEIKANSVLDGAEVAADCIIGPFARLRPGTVLSSEVHIGNFVEIKNSLIQEKTKVNHLSYVGDSDVGKQVNVGAGTITCNYDGVNKHKTIIEDYVHIGSDTQLVAPVTVGEGATIGAGSTITQNVPPYTLTLTQRLEQRTIKNWQRPKKKAAKES